MSTDKASGKTGDEGGDKRPVRPCPQCSKLSTEKYYPFCSARCADVDLHRWLSGNYSIPAVELDDVAPEELDALGDLHDPERRISR